MYQIIFSDINNPGMKFDVKVSGNTLPEIEALVCRYMGSHLNAGNIILIHKGNLEYDIYALGSPIAHAQIVSIGG